MFPGQSLQKCSQEYISMEKMGVVAGVFHPNINGKHKVGVLWSRQVSGK
jgi:hypothetical protein